MKQVVVVLVALAALAGSFYLGKMSSDKSQLLSPPFPPPAGEEAIEQQIKEDEERQKRLILKSQADLPLIASASVEYALKNGHKNPDIMFTSNDGEYATVNLGEATGGGGALLFLVKRENKWIPLISGNGFSSCSEVLPLREKYDLPKDFIPCAEELE